MSFRKAVLLLLAIVALVSATSAHAQFGAYGMFTVDRLSNIASSPEQNPNVTSARSNSVDPLGGTGGVYYDFKKLGPVTLGADLRGSILTTKRGAYEKFNGGGARIYSVLGGVRAVFHTPLAPLKPYVQGSVGLGRSDYGLLYSEAGVTDNGIVGNSPILRNNFEYEGLAGLDIKLLPILDYRVAEFGYGGLDPFGNNSHNYPIKQVSMGFVFHLPF
ncbi:hypothetical protein [Tunturibacter empetritectus]|uniref:Outer membrane protein beta-barrel domain-containing protein n=1 Tax=Tunturiibacter empetritectus TaxID=3069691 RepID=A0A7W8IJW2_9BACT|nr:hypothetical protein [Edaphobacter lichenicola]MBB5317558.1 hypothetical protein [Edaphobacter lichenicola]